MPRSKLSSAGLSNRLLAKLPRTVYGRLAPHLRVVALKLGDVVDIVGQKSQFAYFPTTAVISLMCVMENGETSEIGMLGNEGMTAMAICLGVGVASSQAVVQVAGDAIQIRATALKEEFDRQGPLHDLLLRYVYSLVAQIAQSAGCNTHHTVEARLSRWLLIVSDRVSTDELLLRHDFLSQMLGTHRSAVTIAAGALRAAGLIRYSRGKITITNRQGLEDSACECYRAVRVAYARAKLE